MRIALAAHAGRPRVDAFAETLMTAAGRVGIEVQPSDSVTEPDLVVAIGGDGTMLRAVRLALEHDVPVLGFNLGNFGFIAEAEPGEVNEVMKRLAAGKFVTRDRMTVEACLPGGAPAAGVNDVVVEKIDSQRLVALDVAIDGEPYLTYRADGLIVATPTGSTAYSFSAGGPLVDPDLEALVLTPVAAHSLFSSSLVLAPESKVAIAVTEDRPVRMSVDGREVGSFGQGSTIEVGRGSKPARFVTFTRHPFPVTVKHKFRL